MHHSDFNLCCKTNVRITAVESTGQLASVSLGNDDFLLAEIVQNCVSQRKWTEYYKHYVESF